MSPQLPRLSSVLGRGLAYAQHGVDCAAAWTLRGVAQVAREHPEEEQAERQPSSRRSVFLRMPLKIGRRALFFFGDLGEAFYTKYEELKRRE